MKEKPKKEEHHKKVVIKEEEEEKKEKEHKKVCTRQCYEHSVTRTFPEEHCVGVNTQSRTKITASAGLG